MRSLMFWGLHFSLLLAVSTCNQHSQSGSPAIPSPRLSSPTVKQPEISQPEISQPEINSPEIETPEIRVPEINAPEIKVPEITVPEIQVREDDDAAVISVPADILFDFDKDTIRPDAEAALQQINRGIAARYPQGQMLILGHTDSMGSDTYNQGLSERRAIAVQRWLTEQGGINSARMRTQGLGETRPVAPNSNPDGSDNPEGRQRNRRVEIVIARANPTQSGQ
jgi:outer membrane protein OmpA-like peptidoglycan-associated protein